MLRTAIAPVEVRVSGALEADGVFLFVVGGGEAAEVGGSRSISVEAIAR